MAKVAQDYLRVVLAVEFVQDMQSRQSGDKKNMN